MARSDENLNRTESFYSLDEPTIDSTSGDFIIVDDPPPQSVSAGTLYELLDPLGSGGAGHVYRARQIGLDRDIAIKILKAEYLDRTEIVRRFKKEAVIISRLQHPGIAQVYDIGNCEDGRPFYTMKLVEGWTLDELLRVQAKSLHDPLTIFALISQTVAYAHAEGIVHLDIKPANIMVGSFGETHLMDWGNAKILNEITAEDQTNADSLELHIGGTPAYMSPQQATNEPVSKSFDVFMLGATLCQILIGESPYSSSSPRETHAKAVEGDLEAVFGKLDRCEYDSALIRLAKQCLEPIQADRPSDAGYVAAEMAYYQQSALKRYESDMTRFFELSLDLFCIAGFDGFFRRINSNFSKVLGFSEAELLQRPFLTFVLPEDRDETVRQMGVLLEGKPVVQFRNRYVTADNEIVEFEWTSKSIPDENMIFAVARLIEPRSIEPR